MSISIRTPLAASEPSITITPPVISCSESLTVEGEGLIPGSKVIISTGMVEEIPESVFEAYWGPVPVSDTGSFEIEGVKPILNECIGLAPEPLFLTASTVTGNTNEDAFGAPTATASFSVAPDPDDPRLTLLPDHGSGCLEVKVQGEHFEPGTIVTIFVGYFPVGHTFISPGEAAVTEDGTFNFRLPQQVTPFVVTCGDHPLPRDGQQYAVWASTGQGKVGEGYREPSAAHVFTVTLTPAERFHQTWAHTDQPVAQGDVDRTWIWGPEPFTAVLTEEYADAPNGTRAVGYYDKARMEITQPGKDRTNVWYVTSGLLVVEMVTGKVQIGDETFEQRAPAVVNIAGDLDDSRSPTYASLNAVVDELPRPEGSVIIERLDRNGAVAGDDSLAGHDIVATMLDEITNHTVAEPFWDFMNSNGLVWWYGEYEEQSLFNDNPIYATGRPITEAYWTTVRVAGVDTDVLLQCFERRCLTYTPQNEPGWQVESGNVGQHYYNWRYDKMGD